MRRRCVHQAHSASAVLKSPGDTAITMVNRGQCANLHFGLKNPEQNWFKSHNHLVKLYQDFHCGPPYLLQDFPWLRVPQRATNILPSCFVKIVFQSVQLKTRHVMHETSCRVHLCYILVKFPDPPWLPGIHLSIFHDTADICETHCLFLPFKFLPLCGIWMYLRKVSEDAKLYFSW